MPSCEKCWADAFRQTYGSSTDQATRYAELVKERNCTPEEQAGPDATVCSGCGRKTVHMICHVCMACGEEGEG